MGRPQGSTLGMIARRGKRTKPPAQGTPADALRQILPIAYHEAGHAVANYLLGQRVRSVSIVPALYWQRRKRGMAVLRQGASRGDWAFDPFDPRTPNELRRKVIIGALAGDAAVSLMLGRRFAATHPGYCASRFGSLLFGSVTDAIVVVELVGRMAASGRKRSSRKQLEQQIRGLRRKALALLRPYRNAISAVSAELITHRRLSGKRLPQIIRESTRVLSCAR